MQRQFILVFLLLLGAGGINAQQLSLDPAAPTPLETVRLRYTHAGCTNPDSVRLAQTANRITVQVDRVFFPDCGTINGYYEDFTLGRLPSGSYDAELMANPPPGTLGPTVMVGSVHFDVAPLPPTGSLHPHENYSDIWWNAKESGRHVLACRARDEAGNVQSTEQQWNVGGYANTAVQRVVITVG